MEQENINQCRLRILEIEAKNSRYGQVLGFIILFTMIAGGFFLVFIGRSIGGYATIVSSIMLGLAAVLYNKRIKSSFLHFTLNIFLTPQLFLSPQLHLDERGYNLLKDE